MSDLSNIAGTLKYGYFDGTKRKKILIAYTASTVFLTLGLFGLLIALILEQVNKTNPMPSVEFVFLIIGLIVAFSVFFVSISVLIIRNEKIRKEINLWLLDAVELGAFCEMLLPDHNDTPLLDAVFSLPPTRAKIRVKFKYNGKHYSKDSGYKSKSGEFKNDYQAIWVKYADKSINILYSPKYDEVIILKNKS